MDETKLSELIKSGKTALIVIDMQGDYCELGYYMDKAGYDLERLRRPIPQIAKVLSAVRTTDIPVIYTRQYRLPNNNDTSEAASTFPSTSLKGEPGWEIISELKPAPDDIVLDKTTCSVFASTGIDELLKKRGIDTLVFCGNTIDVCVHSSLRSANDLDYSCITLADCCGAVNDNLYEWSLESIAIEDGVFGTVAYSQDVVDALK